jgi:general secretion pathway protein J
MRRRSGFTLVEVMVALVVTGMVAALAYAASSAGLATQAQLERHREGAGSEAVLRALLGDALRHQVGGLRGGAPVFHLADRVDAQGAPADSLHLTTRGVQSPLGASAEWSVDAWRRGDTLHLEARPLIPGASAATGGPLAPVRARLAGMRGFDVQLLGRGPVAAWRPDWPEDDVAPDAVLLALAGTDRPGSRLLVRRGLERAP